MNKFLLSIGLLMVAQGSSGLLARKEMSKETLLKGESSLLDAPTVRVIQAAKNASDDDLKKALSLSEYVIGLAKSLTPEEIVVLERNREAIIKKQKEEFKKHRESYEKEQKEVQSSPKAFVMNNLTYPSILIIREAKNVPDKLLIEAILLPFGGNNEEENAVALLRLQAARDLTQQELDSLKKKEEEQLAKLKEIFESMKNNK